MELNNREKQVLADILRTEIFEVEDMIKSGNDKAELESYIEVVKGIFSKLDLE